MEHLDIYNAVRAVPDNAKREIKGGRLNGKTDINPMWRIRQLTEQFGPCGIGWWYTIDRQWLETGCNDEIAAFCDISLYYKVDGETSQPIPGTGGSAFVAKERNGMYTSDECYKMALTDAISVAAKALGIAADVYWDKDSTKYDKPQEPQQPPVEYIDSAQRKKILTLLLTLYGDQDTAAQNMSAAIGYQSVKVVPKREYEIIIKGLSNMIDQKEADGDAAV